MITARNIVKYFGRFQALNNVSFEIGKGEIVGFLGQNGAGKTTLMRILTCYLKPTSGDARVADSDIRKQSLEVRKQIGYLPETPPLYGNLTVKDYLKFSARLKDVPAGRIGLQLDRVLGECQLWEVQNQFIQNLSKGFKQRVGIAQAIIHDPPVLILDEPTSGLDPSQILQVRRLIKGLEQQKTVLISTHVLSEIEEMARRVMIIQSGNIIADQPLESLLASSSNVHRWVLHLNAEKPVIEQVLSAYQGTSTIKIYPGKIARYQVHVESRAGIEKFSQEIIRELISQGCDIVEVRNLPPTLEEVFLKLT